MKHGVWLVAVALSAAAGVLFHANLAWNRAPEARSPARRTDSTPRPAWVAFDRTDAGECRPAGRELICVGEGPISPSDRPDAAEAAALDALLAHVADGIDDPDFIQERAVLEPRIRPGGKHNEVERDLMSRLPLAALDAPAVHDVAVHHERYDVRGDTWHRFFVRWVVRPDAVAALRARYTETRTLFGARFLRIYPRFRLGRGDGAIYVAAVGPGPFADGGLAGGDVVLWAGDGVFVQDLTELAAALATVPELKARRGDQDVEVTLIQSDHPNDPPTP